MVTQHNLQAHEHGICALLHAVERYTTNHIIIRVDETFPEELRSYCVIHDKDDFENVLKNTSNDMQRQIQIFALTYRELLKYSPQELDHHLQIDSNEWSNWGADLILHYCARHRLCGSPIPVLYREE